MKGLKFDLETIADARDGLPMHLTVRGDLADPADTLLKLRALLSFDHGAARYAVQRTVRCAVRRPLEELFDELALHSGFAAQRLDGTSLLLDGPGVFVSARGRRKIDYGSCTFDIWAESLARLNSVRATLLSIVGEQLVRQEMFTIDWHFCSGQMGLSSASFDEIADPAPYDEAYPTPKEPVAAFFTTNLPNIGDIDEALVRPGRCFATARTRALERSEAELLLSRISGGGASPDERSTSFALPASVRSITLAALYRMLNAEG